MTGGITYLSKQWYSDKKRVRFHFYNDLRGWNQVDKFGHFMGGLLAADIFKSSMLWSGINTQKSLLYGAIVGTSLQGSLKSRLLQYLLYA